MESPAIRPASRAPVIPEPKTKIHYMARGPLQSSDRITLNDQGLASTREGLGFTQSPWDG